MPQWFDRVTRTRFGRFCTNLVRRYFAHEVGRQSAALAYYLLFSIFPFLIFLSSLLGLLSLDITGIMAALRPLLPAQVLELVESYLRYVSQTSSTSMLWFGLVFSIYFPMRAADCLMLAVRRAYRLGRPKNQLVYTFKVLLYTVTLLMTIALTLALTTLGGRVLRYVGNYVPLALPQRFLELWDALRFILLGVVVFAAVGFLYALSQDARQPGKGVAPGVLLALAAWMLFSAGYSFYVENFARYSLIYGALGTVIVLMVWLSLTATVLVMGAEVNGTLLSMAKEE